VTQDQSRLALGLHHRYALLIKPLTRQHKRGFLEHLRESIMDKAIFSL